MIDRGKEDLRRQARAWRAALTPGEKARQEEAVARRLAELSAWRDADWVLVYHSTPQELSTRPVLQLAREAKKKVALPRCDHGTHTLDFLEYGGEEMLLPGRMGLLEPDPARCPPATPTERSLCVVPALAADRWGNRLGYGGGWYDRFLAGFPGVSALLIWDRWLLEELPAEAHDQRLDWVVTASESVLVQK